MKPLRIILAGVLETAAHLFEWWLKEVQDKRHPLPPAPKRTYSGPTAKINGEPLPRTPRAPVVGGGPCVCKRGLVCGVHPHTGRLHSDRD